MLSRIGREFAAEIAYRDWSAAPYNLGDDPISGKRLLPSRTDSVRLAVAQAVAQVLAYADPNFDVLEFGERCGLPSYLIEPDSPNVSRLREGIRWDESRAGSPGIPPSVVAEGFAALEVCGRCERDSHEKCLDAGLAWDGFVDLDALTCGCGCWTRDTFDITSPEYFYKRPSPDGGRKG